MANICIVVPCYNEETRLPVNDFREYLLIHYDVDFCFVNDGSTDGTKDLLVKLCKENNNHLFSISLPENKGKAEAVRIGIIQSLSRKDYEIIGFWDADLSTPLDEIQYLKTYIDKNTNYAFAFGSRIKTLGVVIERKLLRHYFGRVFATFASGIVRLPVYDTQCGAKLIKTEVAEKVFCYPFCSKWLFDIEIFARMIEIYGHDEAQKMMVEVPLRKWIDKGNSRITTSYLFKMPFELFSIFAKHRKNMRRADNI